MERDKSIGKIGVYKIADLATKDKHIFDHFYDCWHKIYGWMVYESIYPEFKVSKYSAEDGQHNIQIWKELVQEYDALIGEWDAIALETMPDDLNGSPCRVILMPVYDKGEFIRFAEVR